jgi:hypothetical protein
VKQKPRKLQPCRRSPSRLALDAPGEDLGPNFPHPAGQVGVVLLELGGGLGEQNDDGVDAAPDDRHEDARDNEADEEAQNEHVHLEVGLVHVLGRKEAGGDLDDEADGPYDGAGHERHQQQRVRDQVVGDDRLPPAVLEEREHLLPGLDVREAVDPVSNTVQSSEKEECEKSHII